MAYLNDLYIHVVDEELTDEIEVSSHSVEDGIPLTDNIKRQPYKLSLSGKIVDYETTGSESSKQILKDYYGEVNGEEMYYTAMDLLDNNKPYVKAAEIIAKIKEIEHTGALVHYLGRNDVDNLQIVSFVTKHSYTNSGGADFTMQLQQFRMANNAYPDPVKNIRKTFITGCPTSEQKAMYEVGTSLVEEWYSGSEDTDEVAKEVFDGAENYYAIRYKVMPGDNLWDLLCADNAPFKNLQRHTIYQYRYQYKNESGETEERIGYTLNPDGKELVGENTYWTNDNPLAYVACYPPNAHCFEVPGDGSTLKAYEWLFVGFMERAWL